MEGLELVTEEVMETPHYLCLSEFLLF